jgi:dienelactone hydrolase
MFNKTLYVYFAIALCYWQTAAAVQLPYISYVSIPVQTATENWQVSAQYRQPRLATSNPRPAVIILHSSAGIDSTGAFYAKALNRAGIATLELDLWGARNMLGGSTNRPNTPQETLPDVFAALAYLSQDPMIDADRIGVLGFSWGGVLTLLTATEQYMSMTGAPYRFAGHVAHYPVCWLFNNVPGFELSGLTGAPVMIQTGARDDYDLPETCPQLADNLLEQDKGLVKVKVYKRAHHAWDRLESRIIVEDPYSNLGQGGEVVLAPSFRTAFRSRYKVVHFFNKLFAEESTR